MFFKEQPSDWNTDNADAHKNFLHSVDTGSDKGTDIPETQEDKLIEFLEADDLYTFIYARYIRGEEGTDHYAAYSKVHDLWHGVTYYADRAIQGPDKRNKYRTKVKEFTLVFVDFIRATRERMVTDNILTKRKKIKRFTTYITKITANSKEDITYTMIDTESDELPQVQLLGSDNKSFKSLMKQLIVGVFGQ